jgi:hypothetical protein
MKKLILLAVLIVAGFAAKAQTVPPSPIKKDKITDMTKAIIMFICPKCDYMSTKPGTCPHDKSTLIKEGTYYCTMDVDQTSDTPAKCPKCGMEMVKMDKKDKQEMKKDSVK